MSTATNPPPSPGPLLPVTTIARVCQLTPAQIYAAHTSAMGSPGHYVFPIGAPCQSYTLEGLCALVEGLQENGHDLEAKVLAEEVKRLRQPAKSSLTRWDHRHEARSEEAAA